MGVIARGSDSTREHHGGVEPGGRYITITSETHAPSETAPVGGATEAQLSTESLPTLEHDGAALTLPATATPFAPGITSNSSGTPAATSHHETTTPSTIVETSTSSSDMKVMLTTSSPHAIDIVTTAGSSVSTAVMSVVGSSHTIPSSGVITAGTPADSMAIVIVSTMAWLLKAQTDVMAKAAAVQSLPPLSCFRGEGDDLLDDGYDKWVEKFRERAWLANWSPEDQLYQLKLHLQKTARNVFRMLPRSECNNVESAIAALNNRFKLRDIEDPRGLEFNHKTQGERINQLCISIQQLGRKASPSIMDKDLDCLLKGRFYQALLVK